MTGSLTESFRGPFVGIDVGENFLDLAIVGATTDMLVFRRVGLDGLDESPCAALAQRISAAAPVLDAHATALVDSPRWPRDLDWSTPSRRRDPVPHTREIDVELRRIFSALMAAPASEARKRALSMFPTPPLGYFARCARGAQCKPHLKAIARELFDWVWRASDDGGDAREPVAESGGTFTRFMLAGFATYRALERLGVAAFESYPDLQLRLSSPSTRLPPKKRRTEALAVRRRIVALLAVRLGLRDPPLPANLDQADAAVLALAAAASARSDTLCVVSNPCEGRFMLALDAHQARRLGPGHT